MEQLRLLSATKRTLTAGQQKVDSHLRRLGWPRGAEAQILPTPLVSAPWQQGGRVHVYVRLHTTSPEALAELRERGLTVERLNERLGVAQGWASAADLPRLAELDAVAAIQPVLPAVHQVGAVTSEGDTASRANLVRAEGYYGSGVTVGVISTGIDSLASAQATGDLGAVTVPPDPRCQRGTGDEGTAMLEIVHDLAPGASLLFSGAPTTLDLIDAVNCLRAAGARIIVDDLLSFGEPFFEDGPVAQTVRAAVQAGVSYFAAAGNYAQQHVEQVYCPGPGGLHDFVCGSGLIAVEKVVPPGLMLTCVLQWDDPFGAAADDYDLAAIDAISLVPLAFSGNLQNGTQNPIEEFSYTNPLLTPELVAVGIGLASGRPRLLDLFCVDETGDPLSIVTPSGSIFGHPAVLEVVAVAAVDVAMPGLATVEAFSSEGPVSILFPALETRMKPDLAGFDDVSTTLAPPFSPFRGTSAAAPHAAAVAALLLNKNPFLTPGQVKSVLMSTAVNIGAAPSVAGAGRLDALTAANAVAVPECLTDSACDDADACTADSCTAGRCTHASISCDDGIACTVDSCLPATGCVHTVADGPGGVFCLWTIARRVSSCDSPPVPASVDHRMEKAGGLVDSALTVSQVGRGRRLLRNARHTLRATRPLVVKAMRKGKISRDCGARLAQAIQDGLQRLP